MTRHGAQAADNTDSGEREHPARFRRHSAGGSSRAANYGFETSADVTLLALELSGNMPDKAGNVPALRMREGLRRRGGFTPYVGSAQGAVSLADWGNVPGIREMNRRHQR